MSYNRYQGGVVGVVYRRRDSKLEYLMLHRRKRSRGKYRGWVLLKGRTEDKPKIGFFENEEYRLRQELSEEAGIGAGDIRNIQKIPGLRVVYEFSKRDEKYSQPLSGYTPRIGRNMQVFAVEVKPEVNIQVDFNEHDDFNWSELSEAKRVLRFENYIETLEVANKFITKNLKQQS